VITVHLPSDLAETVGAPATIAATAQPSVAELVAHLDRLYPGLRSRLLWPDGSLRPHLNVFVDGLDVRRQGGLGAALADGAEVWVLRAVSGGAEEAPVVKGEGGGGVAFLRPLGLYTGAPYAYGAVVGKGALVFTAGACPLDELGRVVAPGDVAAQARQALGNLKATLAAAGCDWAHVVKATVYVAARDREDLLAAWRAVEAAFGTPTPPATLVGVHLLGYSDQRVEIEAVAVRPEGAGESR
jgi:enamine deaminase RidA (YjgF/YER057c/UK114 family)